MLLRSPIVLFSGIAALVLATNGADAQSTTGASSNPTSSSTASTAAGESSPTSTGATPASDAPATDESSGSEDDDESEEREYSGAHPHEEPGRAYHFLGAFYRYHIMPGRLLELFVDVAPSSVTTQQMGLEFSHRRDAFEIIANLYYADFSMVGPFLGRNHPPGDVQIIDSDLWVVMGGATFLWSSHFSDWFAIEWGLGVGIGATFGDVHRTEAYPTNDGYAACVPPAAAGQPGSADPAAPFSDAATTNGETIDQYCGAPTTYPTDPDGSKGQHYNVRSRTWFQGGSVPNLWFRFAPQLSLRFKPMHQLVFRIDGGFDFLSGPFVGAAAAIGF